MNCVSLICFRHWNFNSISIQYCSGLRHVTFYKVIIKVDCPVLIIYQIFGQFITSWQVNVNYRKGGCKLGAVNTCCNFNKNKYTVNKKKIKSTRIFGIFLIMPLTTIDFCHLKFPIFIYWSDPQLNGHDDCRSHDHKKKLATASGVDFRPPDQSITLRQEGTGKRLLTVCY